MRRFSERTPWRRRRALASTLAAATTLVLSACGPAGDGHPEPNALVDQYLTAIAEGDATTASMLDAAAIESAHGDDERIDVQTLRSDDVLEFAIAGLRDTLSDDPSTAPLRYLVYPGVYRVASAIPARLLTRDAETVQLVVATLEADAGAQFDVVQLPSDAD